MTDDPFDEPLVVALLNDEPTITPRVPRTATTAERYRFLKTKRRGVTWQEGDQGSFHQTAIIHLGRDRH